jgi:hypothetical protein
MSRSWLQKKRKGELIELAQTAKIPEYAILVLGFIRAAKFALAVPMATSKTTLST